MSSNKIYKIENSSIYVYSARIFLNSTMYLINEIAEWNLSYKYYTTRLSLVVHPFNPRIIFIVQFWDIT